MVSENSNPQKHLNNNITSQFSCSVIFNNPVQKFICKTLPAWFMELLKSTLNDHKLSGSLQNGIK